MALPAESVGYSVEEFGALLKRAEKIAIEAEATNGAAEEAAKVKEEKGEADLDDGDTADSPGSD